MPRNGINGIGRRAVAEIGIASLSHQTTIHDIRAIKYQELTLRPSGDGRQKMMIAISGPSHRNTSRIDSLKLTAMSFLQLTRHQANGRLVISEMRSEVPQAVAASASLHFPVQKRYERAFLVATSPQPKDWNRYPRWIRLGCRKS